MGTSEPVSKLFKNPSKIDIVLVILFIILLIFL